MISRVFVWFRFDKPILHKLRIERVKLPVSNSSVEIGSKNFNCFWILYYVYINMKQKIAIIGWWAAGMMATATLIEAGYDGEIHLFEKNKNLGAKVIISGWWRCNVTTGYYRWKDLEWKYIRWSEFVREAIGQFGPRKIFQRFEDHNVPLKMEEDMRVFPQSDNGKDILWVFEKLFARHKNCRLQLWSKIDDIRHENNNFILHTSDQKILFDKIIIATGGNAYTHTWSTGDAYNRAKNLWHTITPLWPSLNSFLSEKKWAHELSGISFDQAKLWVTLSDWEKREIIWPILLTHFGLSWPATFIVSAYSSFEKIDKNNPLMVWVSPFAYMDRVVWDSFLLEQSTKNPRKQISTILHQYLPQRMIDILDTHIFHKQLQWSIGLCSRELRLWIAQFLWWGWTYKVVGRRAGDEFVTAGWVSLDEVNNKTMESKIVPWLYFVGEILDIDGVTWWYNLTSSWATGRLAGKHLYNNSF